MNREKAGNSANKNAIIGNIILTILNFVIGSLAGSTALVAEAANNLGDCLSTAISWFAFRIGNRKPDEEHPYGYGRIEPLMSIFIALLLFYVSYGILTDAYSKFITVGSLTAPNWISAVMALIAAVICFYMSKNLTKTGIKINSQLLIAQGNEKMTDVYVSITIFCGIVGAHLGYPILDPILAVVIAALVIKVGFEMFLENIENLLGHVPKGLTDKIMKVALSVNEVRDVRNLKINTVGPTNSCELDLILNDESSFDDVYEISNKVESEIVRSINFISSASIHVVPDTKIITDDF
jgi:cation diffusion facilitator family transporter